VSTNPTPPPAPVQPQRYTTDGLTYLRPSPDGKWVSYAAHAARLAAVEGDNARLRNIIAQIESHKPSRVTGGLCVHCNEQFVGEGWIAHFQKHATTCEKHPFAAAVRAVVNADLRGSTMTTSQVAALDLCRLALAPASATLAAANRWAEENHPLLRCVHGQALKDGAGESLEPDCGCRAPATGKAVSQ
jgi:hypothetical protein